MKVDGVAFRNWVGLVFFFPGFKSRKKVILVFKVLYEIQADDFIIH